MRIKFQTAIILIVLIFACNVGKRNQADQIITEFQQQNVPDRRESVFHIFASFEKGKLVLKGESDDPLLKNQLISKLNFLDFEDKIIELPDSSVGEKLFGLVNLPVANLRSSPGHSAELATQALMGTPVKMLKKANGWFLVQTPDKYISWIDPDGIQPVTKNDLEKWRNAKRLIFTDDFGLIYHGEDLIDPVSNVTLGTILEEVERNFKYIKIKFPDGRLGFAAPEFWIGFDEFRDRARLDSANIILLAKNLAGRPYLWGGTSAMAMDCSGFVKTVFFMEGIILARDASLQTRHGVLVEVANNYENIQPGDLLFFGKKMTETEPEKVTHVAISLGGTEYIHASGLVKFNSFDVKSVFYSEYRKNTFIRARRIIGSEGSDGIQKICEHLWY